MLKLIFAAACLFSSSALAGGCAHFGEEITLTGRYALHVLAVPLPGTPDPRGDAGRTSNLLYLASPLCVAGDNVSEGVPAAADIQVLCPDTVAGGGTSISGRLFGAHTENGHNPVLLVCPSFGRTPPLRPLPARGGSV